MTELKVGDRVTVKDTYDEHKGKALEIGAIGASGGYHIGPVGHDRDRYHDVDKGSLFYPAHNVTKLEDENHLKVGDKVIVDLDRPSSSWHKVEGVVIATRIYNRESTAKVRVTKNGPNCSNRIGIESTLVNLTKLDDVLKPFKVGDLVRFAEPYNDHWQGGKAKVVGFGEGKSSVKVEVIEGPPKNTIYKEGGRTVNFNPDHLKLWEDPTFKVGDIVKPKAGAFTYTRHKGKTLIVTNVRRKTVAGDYKYFVRALGQPSASVGYRADELEAGEPLAQWEIELLDGTAVKVTTPTLPDYAAADVKATESLFAKGGLIKPEAVDGPAHYGGKDNPYEVIKVAEAWGFEKNAYLFNALKYLGRAGKKGSKVEDLKKLVFYVQREIALEEASGKW